MGLNNVKQMVSAILEELHRCLGLGRVNPKSDSVSARLLNIEVRQRVNAIEPVPKVSISTDGIEETMSVSVSMPPAGHAEAIAQVLESRRTLTGDETEQRVAVVENAHLDRIGQHIYGKVSPDAGRNWRSGHRKAGARRTVPEAAHGNS